MGLQAKTIQYFGFLPVYGNTPSNLYLVSSSEAGDINIGDVVVFATSTPIGGPATVKKFPAEASTEFLVGIAASAVKANDGSTAPKAGWRNLSSQTLMVYDDPDSIFVTQDTTSGVVGQGSSAIGIGKAVRVAATGAIGSTGTRGIDGPSVMAISAVTASSGSTRAYLFQLVGLHPIENDWSTVAPGTASTGTGADHAVRKLLVRPFQHYTRLVTEASHAGVITT